MQQSGFEALGSEFFEAMCFDMCSQSYSCMKVVVVDDVIEMELRLQVVVVV